MLIDRIEPGVAALDRRLKARAVSSAMKHALSHLREQPEIAKVALQRGLDDVDLRAITSNHRPLTQACARYIYEQTDDSGIPKYAGIRYLSHYGAGSEWECWAIFSDRMARRGEYADPTILPDDPGLLGAAKIHKVTIEVFDGYDIRP